MITNPKEQKICDKFSAYDDMFIVLNVLWLRGILTDMISAVRRTAIITDVLESGNMMIVKI